VKGIVIYKVGRITSLAALFCWGAVGCSSDSPVPADPLLSPQAEIAASRGQTQAVLEQRTEPAVRFTDVAEEAGIDFVHLSGGPEQRYILEAMGSGSAFFDFDSDGWLDFFAVNATRLEGEPGTGNRLWRNVPGEGGRKFLDLTATAGLGQVGWGMGCAVADYDNDGDLDLYLTNWGANALYRNGGNGTFAPVRAGVDNDRWGASAAFGDLDADGWLDLYVTNYVEFDLDAPPGDGQLCSGWKGLTVFCGPYGLDGDADLLYRNEGGRGFADMSSATGIDQWDYLGLGVIFTDYDRDGDQDIYIANDSTPNQLYRNDGDWQLAEVGAFAGVAYSEEGRVQAGMGLDVGDYDNDGDEDLVVTNFSDDVNTLYQNRGDGSFADATHTIGLGGEVRPYLGWSAALADFDLDGWLDLFVANGHLYPQLEVHPLGLSYRQRNLLYWNYGGIFSLASPEILNVEQVSRGAAFGDYDNDGDLDIAVNNLNDRPNLLRNDGGNYNNWLGIELRAEDRRPVEGAMVRLWTEERELVRQAKRSYGYLSASDGRVLFGLGGLAAEKIEIHWPSGQTQIVEDLPERRYLVVREGAGTALAEYSTPASANAMASVAPRESPVASIVEIPLKPSWTADTYYEKATALYEQGRYRESLALLRPALEYYPGATRLHYTAGVALYSGLGRYDEAIEVLERAMAQDSVVVEAVELLGIAYLQLNQRDKAIAMLERARIQAPGRWQTHYRLGLAHERLGTDSAAVAAFRRALELAPDEPMPYLHLARIHERAGQQQAAVEALRRFEALEPLKQEVDRYRQAIRANPSHPAAYAELGMVFSRTGRLVEAQEHLERALELDPNVAATRTNLGNILLRRGAAGPAAEHFRRALNLESELAEAHYGLGMAHYALKEFPQALTSLERALAARPNFTKALINLGVILQEQGRPGQALTHFRRAVDLAPDDTRAGNNLVAVLLRVGEIDEARQVFEQAAARQVHLPHARKALVQALAGMAQAYAEQDHFAAAAERQRQAIALTPQKLRERLVRQLAIYESNMR